jgi:hypothetical protein
MEAVGIERLFGRPLFLTRLTDWRWEPCNCDRFTLLIAADASTVTDAAIRAYAYAALTDGCDYLCAWGPDCERVHDRFDDTHLGLETQSPQPMMISTWHADETLPEALYFALTLAFPDSDATRSRDDRAPVVLAVAEQWIEEVRALIGDQDELNRLFTERD